LCAVRGVRPPARPGSSARHPMSRPPRSSQTVLRQRHRAQHLFFWVHLFERLLENLAFQRLLAEQALELTYLGLQGSILGRRHHFLASAGGRQRTLGCEPPPREQLVRRDAVLARHKAHRHARRIGLLDNPHLLGWCPPTPPLRALQNLGTDRPLFNDVSQNVGHKTHSYIRVGAWPGSLGAASRATDSDQSSRVLMP